jgi:hypothetical protein
VTITNRVSLRSVMSGNTPIADVVDAPTIGAATAGIESATVAYTAAATGGTATSFTAISTPGSITGTGASPITVSGLTGGTAYTFQVYGTNASGVWSGVQSAASSSVTPTTTAFESIATATGTGSSNTITFSSIPSTFTHLQVRAITRGTGANGWENFSVRVSGGSFVNEYASHLLRGTGASVSAVSYTTQSTLQSLRTTDAGSAAGIMGVLIMDVHDYASTTKNKTIQIVHGFDDANVSGVQNVELRSGVRLNTAAVNTVEFQISSGSWATTTQFALYGIRGA